MTPTEKKAIGMLNEIHRVIGFEKVLKCGCFNVAIEKVAEKYIKQAINETKEEDYEELIHLLEFHSDETREGLIQEMEKELANIRASKLKE